MTKFEVNIDGKVYPCKSTMGALLRFKEETGRDPQLTGTSDMCVFIWCCAKSACAREGIDFPFTLMDFADAVDEDQLLAVIQLMAEGQQEQKKMTMEKR